MSGTGACGGQPSPLPPRRLVISEQTNDGVPGLAELGLVAPGLEVAWMGNWPPPGVSPVKAGRAAEILGREFDAVVLDARDGLDADALGAVAGTIRAGGALVLVTPLMEAWPHYRDPEYARLGVAAGEQVGGGFLRRLVRVIRRHPHVRLLPGGLPLNLAPQRRAQAGAADGCCTEDQRGAVRELVHLGHGRARRPVVLSADRGRGKSAALGLAAAQLLRDGYGRIVVTGPRPAVAEQVFVHAARRLPGAEAAAGRLRIAGGELVFRMPDELAGDEAPDAARVLLVDEAAAIPAPLLERLLARYPRIAFATTVHGYEGTGRGFAVRFHEVLNRRTPQWRRRFLRTPIRWAEGDPLERFVSDALLLDAAAAPDAVAAAAEPDSLALVALPRARLLQREGLLRELFGLLVLAHYRTRPFDLRVLLDTPNVRLFVGLQQGHVVAAALVAIEGGFDAATARAIGSGRRRPQGHLMPETLAAHLGLQDAAQRVGARVVRVAVHPQARRRGLGTHLIAALPVLLTEPVEYWGSCFGATAPLLRFWRGAGYVPVRLSVTRGAASGAHSALVLGGGGELAGTLRRRARRRMAGQLPAQLADPLARLEPEVAAALLDGLGEAGAVPGEDDWRDAVAFVAGHRMFEVVPGSLSRLALWALSRRCDGTLGEAERDALILKLLQKRGWPACARALGVAGRGQVLALMRAAIGRLLAAHAPPGLGSEAAGDTPGGWRP